MADSPLIYGQKRLGGAVWFLEAPMYYRRDGSPYTGSLQAQTLAWGRDYSLMGIRQVRETETPWGEVVSTIWTGLGGVEPMFGHAPRIFETAIVTRRGVTALQKHTTEVDAIRFHEWLCFWALVPPCLRFLLCSQTAVDYLLTRY